PLTLDLPERPGAGVRMRRPEGEAGAVWRVPAPSPAAAPASAAPSQAGPKPKTGPKPAAVAAAPTAPVDWRARHAFALEITDWQVAPYAEDGPAFQAAGTASGRVVVVFKGEGSRQDAFVVGRFTDAVVRYMGRP